MIPFPVDERVSLDENQKAKVEKKIWSNTTIKESIGGPVDPLTRLRVKKLKEAFNGLLQDTWAKVDFKRICNNKEQALINLIHVQERLVRGTRTITQGLGEKD